MPTPTPIISEPPSQSLSYRLTNDTPFSFSWEVLTVVGSFIFAGVALAAKCYIQHERMRSDVTDVKSDVTDVKSDVTEMRAEIKSDGIDMRKENKEDFKELKSAIGRLELNMSLFSTVVGRLEKDLEQLKEYIKNSDKQLQENRIKNLDLEEKYQAIIEDLKSIRAILIVVESHDKTIEEMIRRIDNLRRCDV